MNKNLRGERKGKDMGNWNVVAVLAVTGDKL